MTKSDRKEILKATQINAEKYLTSKETAIVYLIELRALAKKGNYPNIFVLNVPTKDRSDAWISWLRHFYQKKYFQLR